MFVLNKFINANKYITITFFHILHMLLNYNFNINCNKINSLKKYFSK